MLFSSSHFQTTFEDHNLNYTRFPAFVANTRLLALTAGYVHFLTYRVCFPIVLYFLALATGLLIFLPVPPVPYFPVLAAGYQISRACRLSSIFLRLSAGICCYVKLWLAYGTISVVMIVITFVWVSWKSLINRVNWLMVMFDQQAAVVAREAVVGTEAEVVVFYSSTSATHWT